MDVELPGKRKSLEMNTEKSLERAPGKVFGRILAMSWIRLTAPYDSLGDEAKASTVAKEAGQSLLFTISIQAVGRGAGASTSASTRSKRSAPRRPAGAGARARAAHVHGESPRRKPLSSARGRYENCQTFGWR